jgi:hypothetical protein
MPININKLYIVDLDNTLYNTWPSLVSSSRRNFLKYFYFSEVVRNLTLPKFNKLMDKIEKRCSSNHVLFLTARNKIHYPATLIKLVCDFGWRGWKLKLVPDAHSKVPVIKKMLNKYKLVVVIDDFSYNHEIGVVSIYWQVIEDLAKTNAKVITGERLKRLQ